MPLLWISIAFIAGAVIPLFRPIPLMGFAITGGVLFLAGLVERRFLSRFSVYRRLRGIVPVPVCLLAAALMGGMVRGESGRPVFGPDSLAYYNDGGRVTLLVMASQPVENHDKSTLLTATSRFMKVGDGPAVVTGDMVILLPAGSHYEYGDLLEVTGSLETPPEREDFSYRQYLENRGVYSYMTYPRIEVVGTGAGNPVYTVLYQWRDRIAQTVKQIIPQPEAAFLSGMLVGRDEDIPDALKKSFQVTGTSHLVAISGFNITILAGLILAFLGRLLPKRKAVWPAVFLLAGYAIMAGASPSVIRAAIMGALAMIGSSIGRNRTAINSLGLASAVMVLFTPLIVRDIGFQLSVSATAGILLIGAPITEWLSNRNISLDKPAEVNAFREMVYDSFVITLAAQVTTLPLLLYHFHQYPLIGLLVNPCVLPVQPAAMIVGGLAALVGLVWLPAGKLLGLIAWIPLAYTTKVVELFSGFHKVGLVSVNLTLWQTALAFLAVGAAILFRKAWMKKLQTGFNVLLFVVPGILLIYLVNRYATMPDGRLHIQVFRQGGDLSSLILTPGGQHILVTNRPGDKDLVGFVDRRLPVLQKSLDAVIMPNATASSSILLADSLAHFQPEKLLVNDQAGGARVQSKLTAELVDGEHSSQPLETGQRFDLGQGAELDVQSLDEKGGYLVIVWGGETIGLHYGNPADKISNSSPDANKMDLLLLDHPADGVTGKGIPVVLDSKKMNLETGNQVTINDGKWIEIRSDGMNTFLFGDPNEID